MLVQANFGQQKNILQSQRLDTNGTSILFSDMSFYTVFTENMKTSCQGILRMLLVTNDTGLSLLF